MSNASKLVARYKDRPSWVSSGLLGFRLALSDVEEALRTYSELDHSSPPPREVAGAIAHILRKGARGKSNRRRKAEMSIATFQKIFHAVHDSRALARAMTLAKERNRAGAALREIGKEYGIDPKKIQRFAHLMPVASDELRFLQKARVV